MRRLEPRGPPDHRQPFEPGSGLPSWELGSRLGRYQAKLPQERHLVEIKVLGLDLAILNLED